MIRTTLGMGGKSLSKELLEADLSVSNAAFVQRQYAPSTSSFVILQLKSLKQREYLS